ncbi:MAG: hypothetical protein HZC41_09830 [Chloroflexi bacterium]|nr:hypothetical protein [Chloroflexota bacterium]
MTLKLHRLVVSGALLAVLLATVPALAQLSAVTVTVERVMANADGSITVSGRLPNPCYRLLPPDQIVTGRTITITLQARAVQGVMCAQVIKPFETTIPIDTTGLTAGTYTAVVNGVSATLTLTPGAAAPDQPRPTATAPDQPAASAADCLTRVTRNRSYQDNRAGFCLLYPLTYWVIEHEDTKNAISIVPETDAASRATLNISHEAVDGRTLDDVAEAVQAEYPNLSIQFNQTTIGGQPAVVTEDLPGRRPTRQAFVIANDRLFRLVLEPVRAGADVLWETVTESLIFFPAIDSPLKGRCEG